MGVLGGCDSEGGQSDVSVGEGSTAFGTYSLSLNYRLPFPTSLNVLVGSPFSLSWLLDESFSGRPFLRVLFPSLSRVFARGCQFR